jgi:hypothetical protein
MIPKMVRMQDRRLIIPFCAINFGDRAMQMASSTGGASDSRQMYFDAPENLAPVEATAEGLGCV